MAIAHPADLVPGSGDYEIRKIGFDDLRISLRQGWEDFQAKRGDLVFIGFIYPLVVLFAILIASRVSILPLLFPLLAGSILFSPPLASGFYELARRREQGLDARWRHFLDVVRGPSAPSLFDLTSVTAMLFLAWIAAAWFIYNATVGGLGPDAVSSVEAFLNAVFGTTEGWKMIIIGNLVGLGFAIVALAISVVSFPMIIDKNVNWGVALRTSVRVAWNNPVTVATWGLIVVGLLTLGALPGLVGLAVVLPLLGYATWHLYTRAVVR
ncbi:MULTISPECIES: DUF2189 domain-containing protein [Sphingobium]|uniref:DUF2189 domain-containing protein n=1 Tax=Sphingobium sp. MI1205 TaxID=407020 RepID=UPI0007704E57|nr:DUF2189 domain-containing protein [Sphingobium sp. MI1205]AMK19293.1 hypothetical protein K663_14575 [Sphingobium sp. MI1205]